MTGWKGFDGFGTGGYELLVTYSEEGVIMVGVIQPKFMETGY